MSRIAPLSISNSEFHMIPPPTTVISVDRVSLSYGDRIILNEVSFSLQPGDFMYLVGRTGAGKSTLLRTLYADQRPDAGTLQVESFAVNELGRQDIPFLRRRLGIIFQDYQLLPDRNVTQNIHFALQASGWRKSTAIKRRINEVLLQVGMTGRRDAMPHQLSGGEQQRVAIARALINHPAVIIADEPTGNLDPHAAHYIMDILRKICSQGTTLLMATHEYSLIHEFPGQVLELAGESWQHYPDSKDFLLAYSRRLR
jgi:cell division transport system ATP-binding protein